MAKGFPDKKFIDRTGIKFGSWLVVCRLPNKGRQTRWRVKCICGSEKEMSSSAFWQGRKKNKCLACYRGRGSSEETAIDRILHTYKKTALNRGLVFALSYEQFKNLLSGRCFFCKIPSQNKLVLSPHYFYQYSGIDRLDNDLGYIQSNCVSCCIVCNRAKANLEIHEFMEWIERVTENTKHTREATQIFQNIMLKATKGLDASGTSVPPA